MPIVALVSDLIFESKITGTAAHLDVSVKVVRTPAAALQAAADAVGLLVDLHVPTGDALQLVRDAKTARPQLPVIAFLSHVQVELARQAREAGADEVLPRSKFTKQLPDILNRLNGQSAPKP